MFSEILKFFDSIFIVFLSLFYTIMEVLFGPGSLLKLNEEYFWVIVLLLLAFFLLV